MSQNGKRITLADVAAEAGVSMSSVGNVIRGHPHVRQSVRDRVQEAVEKLGYRPLAIGQNLRYGRTGMISLAIPNFAQPYFAEIARRTVQAAAAHDLRVNVQQTDNDLERERDASDAWKLGTSDGLIFSPSVISDEEIERRRGAMPLVLLGEHSKLTTLDRVGIDSVAVGTMATQHLVDTGRRRIGMLGHKVFGDASVVSEREQGYQEVLDAAGLSRPFPIIEVTDWTRTDGLTATRQLLADGPQFDALFCANDLLALGALRAMHEAGRRVPEDVAIVGVDDIEESSFSEPTLTTVAIDREWMIDTAMAMLSNRIADPAAEPHQVSTPLRLVIRDSTCRP